MSPPRHIPGPALTPRTCLLGLALAAGLAFAPGCGDSATDSTAAPGKSAATQTPATARPAGKSTATSPRSASPESPAKPATASTDPFELPPEGDWPGLRRAVERLATLAPTDTSSVDAINKFQQQRFAALIAASDRLLKSQDSATRYRAVDLKLESLAQLFVLAAPQAKENLMAFSQAASEMMSRDLRESLDGDARQTATRIKLTALLLRTVDDSQAAVDEFLGFAHDCKQHANPTIVRQAYDNVLTLHLRRMGEQRELDAAAIVEEVQEITRKLPPSANSLRMLLSVLQQLESYGQIAAAQKVHALIANRFPLPAKDAPVVAPDPNAVDPNFVDPNLAAEAHHYLQPIGKRLAIVGQPLEIVGKTAAGEPFPWRNYRGKVVVVHFFATWQEEKAAPATLPAAGKTADGKAADGKTTAGKATAATASPGGYLPRLRELHAEHRARGLDVVSISLDKAATNLKTFLDEANLPWPVVANLIGAELGAQEPNAAKCGVEAPPMLVLLDRTGKVVLYGNLNKYFETQVTKLLAQKAGK